MSADVPGPLQVGAAFHEAVGAEDGILAEAVADFVYCFVNDVPALVEFGRREQVDLLVTGRLELAADDVNLAHRLLHPVLPEQADEVSGQFGGGIGAARKQDLVVKAAVFDVARVRDAESNSGRGDAMPAQAASHVFGHFFDDDDDFVLVVVVAQENLAFGIGFFADADLFRQDAVVDAPGVVVHLHAEDAEFLFQFPFVCVCEVPHGFDADVR